MTKQPDKLALLTELAKLSPFELAAVMAKVEREETRKLAKGTQPKRTTSKQSWGDHYGIPEGTPLNPR